MCNTRHLSVAAILIGVMTGCLPSTIEIPTATKPKEAVPPPPAIAAPEQQPSPPKQQTGLSMPGGVVNPAALLPQTPQQSLVPPALNAPTNAPGEQAVRAGVGVGAQGRSLDNESGILVTPAKAYFNVRERVIFEAAIPKAVDLFAATEGRKPNSHDEFMTRIIQANSIQLPRLPPDRQYVYDPQQGELLVVRQPR